MDLIDALLWKGRILLFSPSAIPMGDVINWAYDEGHSLKTSRMFGFLHPFMLSAAMRIVRTNLTNDNAQAQISSDHSIRRRC